MLFEQSALSTLKLYYFFKYIIPNTIFSFFSGQQKDEVHSTHNYNTY